MWGTQIIADAKPITKERKATYVRKYSKKQGRFLKIFETGNQTLGHKKLEKAMEKAMEFEKLKRVRTLTFMLQWNITR